MKSLRTTLRPGAEVVHEPNKPSMASFGHGYVEQYRVLGGNEQLLVDFWEAGERVWLPWQVLRQVPGVRGRFESRLQTKAEDAERFRLRNLAYALEQWQSNTGALSRLDIDPLPHQIHLVHRILTSGDLNWMIADDVGLGKTIEVGLLLAALRRRGMKRFLLVVPAGLTRQWTEEMRDKFDIRDFMIYGENFHVNEPSQWKLFDRVVASVDRLKREDHLESILAAEPWDLIVFDEAHWLSRHEYGLKYDVADRYKLASQLRSRTESLLLLTGTPHQGKDDKFRALLELLRPGREWRKRFLQLTREPEMLRELIIRNRKADVTDVDGNFIFRGKDTHTIQVKLSDEEKSFDKQLRHYLRKGYAAGAKAGNLGLAIGFVMTTYRKLAASSLAAITAALERRKRRLLEGEAKTTLPAENDNRYVEGEEDITSSASEFFEGELQLLDDLVSRANALIAHDSKVRYFLKEAVPAVLKKDPREKLLIFTEYRSTQNHLVNELRARYGEETVSLIRGGQSYEERRAAMEHFDSTGQFLVSTEAGGEGLNLHRNCNIMVNFDLPWNPMRLVQRVGRLYRYGQDKRVVVFNMHVPDTLDSEVLKKMYDRLETVAAEMAGVSDEYREGLREDILGELVGSLDMEAIEEMLEAAGQGDIKRSEERMEFALKRAKEAAETQEQILSYATGYDPNELRNELKLDDRHLVSFATGWFELLGIEVTNRLYDDKVWDVRLPPHVQEKLGGGKQNLRLAFDRSAARKAANAALFAPEEPLYELFVRIAKDPKSGGHVAASPCLNGVAGLGAMLRWMDLRGRPVYREYVGIRLFADGTVSVNDECWAKMLLQPMKGEALHPPPSRELWSCLNSQLDAELSRRADDDVHPDRPYPVGALWGADESDGGGNASLEELVTKSTYVDRGSPGSG
ncbi:MAG: helicase-related protein [Trueperaceae bacterium]